MKYHFFIILLGFWTFSQAQNIPKKGSLGIAAAPAPPNEYGGLHAIAEIALNSTAQNLGMALQDILIEINGIKIDTDEKIKQAVGQFIVGDQLTAKVLRGGDLISLEGVIMSKDPIKKPHQELKLLEVPFREGFVRAYLSHPKGDGPFPTIYFIQGYSCQSINIHPLSPEIQLSEALVDMGYAVFRIEKPGAGEHVGLKPCEEYSFDDEVENFNNGLDFLAQYELVDKNQIYIFGHSLGGNVAPLIGTSQTVAGIMVYGTMVKPWQNYLYDMALYSQTYAESPKFVMEQLPILKSSLRKLYEEDISHAELSQAEKDLLKKWHAYSEDGLLFTRTIEFWKNLNRHNFLEAWTKIKCPVLSLFGESDAHAISYLDMELIVNIVNENKADQATYILVEETNHSFAKVPSRKEELDFINKGLATQIAFTRFNKDFPKLIDDWIKSKQKLDVKPQQVSLTSFQKLVNSEMSSMDVIAEDFNGDGHKDFVIATEFGPNRLLIFENGKWIEKVHLPQLKAYALPVKGEDSEDIAYGDFDKDGDLDLFFVSEDTENHELLLNDGKGTFQFSDNQIPKKGQANAVLVYDFNHDGWEDILIGIRGQNELYLNNKGKAFFHEPNKIWPKNQDHTQDLILIDIDNDKDLDIVEGIEKGGNNLFINEEGTFIEKSDRLSLPENLETRKVIPYDFDQDGDMDLFFCNVGWNPSKNAQNQLLDNDGSGHFKNITDRLPSDLSTTLDAVFIDINKDNLIDIVTTNFVNDKKVNVLTSYKKDGQLFFKTKDNLLPELNFMGGVTLLSIHESDHSYLYFGNFNSKDILLQLQLN